MLKIKMVMFWRVVFLGIIVLFVNCLVYFLDFLVEEEKEEKNEDNMNGVRK